MKATAIISMFSVILILVAPVIGWVIGNIFRLRLAVERSEVRQKYRNQIYVVLLTATVPFLPVAFICFSGFLRLAFLIFLALMFFAAVVSAKRGPV
jgi:membrane protein YqaA with SNARE-associated domain